MTLEEENARLRAQVAALREALTKAQGLIAANRLVLGEYAGVRHVLRLEGEVDSALTYTARTAAEHDERVRRGALEEAAQMFAVEREDPADMTHAEFCDWMAARLCALAAEPKDGES